MLVAFMFILFLLNIITIFAVIVLFLRQNRLMEVEKRLNTISSEVETLMTGYLMEMKEENEAFYNKMKENQRLFVSPEEPKESLPSNQAPTLNKDMDVELHYSPKEKSPKQVAVKAYRQHSESQKSEIETLLAKQDIVELSTKAKSRQGKIRSTKIDEALMNQVLKEPTLYEQVELLLEQGLSTEEVAKKLNKGKTEIELLIKFQKTK